MKAKKVKQAVPAPQSGPKGKAVQFWLHDDDKQRIGELRAYLSGQGKRTSDSMIVRAALRVVKGESALLEAYEAVEELDGRLKQHRIAQ